MVAINYVYFDRVSEETLVDMIAGVRRGDVPEAARGGVPGDLKAVSKLLAGVGSLRDEAAR